MRQRVDREKKMKERESESTKLMKNIRWSYRKRHPTGIVRRACRILCTSGVLDRTLTIQGAFAESSMGQGALETDVDVWCWLGRPAILKAMLSVNLRPGEQPA